jgi:hypothetical protein
MRPESQPERPVDGDHRRSADIIPIDSRCRSAHAAQAPGGWRGRGDRTGHPPHTPVVDLLARVRGFRDRELCTADERARAEVDLALIMLSVQREIRRRAGQAVDDIDE